MANMSKVSSRFPWKCNGSAFCPVPAAYNIALKTVPIFKAML